MKVKSGKYIGVITEYFMHSMWQANLMTASTVQSAIAKMCHTLRCILQGAHMGSRLPDMRLLSYHNLITADKTDRRAKKRGENFIFELKKKKKKQKKKTNKQKQFLNISESVRICFIMDLLISLKVSYLLNVLHFLVIHIVACLLKARTVKPVETAVAREQPCKCHVTAGCCNDRSNATIEELWEEVFSVRSMLGLYNEGQLSLQQSTKMWSWAPDGARHQN
jgi:hypothetical protein